MFTAFGDHDRPTKEAFSLVFRNHNNENESIRLPAVPGFAPRQQPSMHRTTACSMNTFKNWIDGLRKPSKCTFKRLPHPFRLNLRFQTGRAPAVNKFSTSTVKFAKSKLYQTPFPSLTPSFGYRYLFFGRPSNVHFLSARGSLSSPETGASAASNVAQGSCAHQTIYYLPYCFLFASDDRA